MNVRRSVLTTQRVVRQRGSSTTLVELPEDAAREDQQRDPGQVERKEAREQGDEGDQADRDHQHDARPARAVALVI